MYLVTYLSVSESEYDHFTTAFSVQNFKITIITHFYHSQGSLFYSKEFERLLDYSEMAAFLPRPCSISIGRGNTIVEFLSAAILLSVCRYLSCRAVPLCEITSAASFKALLALCSPSAAITCRQEISDNLQTGNTEVLMIICRQESESSK